MHPETVRGFHRAQGAQMGRMWFAFKSCVLGVLLLGGGLVGVTLLLFALHRGR